MPGTRVQLNDQHKNEEALYSMMESGWNWNGVLNPDVQYSKL